VITAIVVAAVWHRWILVVPTGGLAVLGYYLASVVEGHAFVFNHLVQEKSGLSQLLLDALVLFVDEGFSFRNFLVDVFTVFVFIAWFWLLITVFMDRSGVMISQAGRKQSGS
jgi:hypothetical protein